MHAFEQKLTIAKYEYFSKFIPNDAKIIDIGCGAGHLSSLLSKKYEVIGIDISAKHSAKNFEYMCMDAMHLAFKDETFDVAILSDILEHTQNPQKLINEASRVIVKNGTILFSTVNKKAIPFLLLKILDLWFSHGRYTGWQPHKYSLLITPEKLHSMMLKANLEKVDVAGVSVGIDKIIMTEKIGLYYCGCYRKTTKFINQHSMYERSLNGC